MKRKKMSKVNGGCAMAKTRRRGGEYVIKVGTMGGGTIDLYVSQRLMQEKYPKHATDKQDVFRVATEAREGWRTIEHDASRHYFAAGRSLCDKWLLFETGDPEEVDDHHPRNCPNCQHELENR